MVPDERFELPTFGLQNRCTTAVLIRRYLLTLQLGQKSPCPNSVLHSLHVFMQYLVYGADDQIRTGDIGLGRTALYQLSYIRINKGLTCCTLIELI